MTSYIIAAVITIAVVAITLALWKAISGRTEDAYERGRLDGHAGGVAAALKETTDFISSFTPDPTVVRRARLEACKTDATATVLHANQEAYYDEFIKAWYGQKNSDSGAELKAVRKRWGSIPHSYDVSGQPHRHFYRVLERWRPEHEIEFICSCGSVVLQPEAKLWPGRKRT